MEVASSKTDEEEEVSFAKQVQNNGVASAAAIATAAVNSAVSMKVRDLTRKGKAGRWAGEKRHHNNTLTTLPSHGSLP